MADHIIGIDFGTRSIKLIAIDNTREPVVTAFDEEPIPLNHDPYVAREGFVEDSDEEETDEEPEAEPADDAEEREEPPPGAPPDFPEDADSTGELAEGENDWEADFDPSFHWIDALESLVSRQTIEEGTEFVTFLPEGRAISIHQDVPFYDPSNVRDILPNLLEDRIPIDPASVVYDFRVITPEESDQHTAIVGIGRKSDVGDFLERLDQGGVNPAVLGIPELMLRYVVEAAVPSEQTAALVDLGHQFTRVIVLDDGVPVLARSLQVGGEDIDERLADKLNLTLEQAESHKIERGTARPAAETRSRQERATSEAIRVALRPLVRDLRRNFQSLYAQDRIELDGIYLCGGTSQVTGIEQYLSDQFGVPVERLSLDSAVEYDILGEVGAPESALSLACALQGVRDRSEQRLLNLRKDEFAYEGRSSYIRAQMTKFGAAAAVLVLLFFGTLFAKQYELERRRTVLKNAVAEQSKKVFGKPVTDPKVVENIAGGETTADRAFVPEMSAYQLYFELMSRISGNIEVELDRIDVDTDRNVIQMSGTTTDPQTVDSLVSDLEGLDCIEDVNKKPVKVQSNNKARFELEIASACS